jgi:MoaA/NifB/PqqE/SkfB family radical SAM enzyme
MKKIYSWSKFAIKNIIATAEIKLAPTKLIFVVTKRCNSRCVYCDIWKTKETPNAFNNELSLTEIQTFAAANPFLQWIDFTGGEPTDRPDFVEVIEAFNTKCPDLLLVHFPTNGIATKQIQAKVQQIKQTLKARLIVTVSIDGPPTINDKLRGITNDFTHAISTFIAVRKEIGITNTYIGMTLHGNTNSYGKSTTELVNDTFNAINTELIKQNETPIEWGTLHLNIPHFSQHYYGNKEPKSCQKIEHAEIAEALQVTSKKQSDTAKTHKTPLAMQLFEKIYRNEALQYLNQGNTNINCAALLTTTYLSEKGEVYPCTIWNKPLGNIRNTNYQLLPIIKNAQQQGIRKEIIEKKCPQCWTPCEAYPAIINSPLKSLKTLLQP